MLIAHCWGLIMRISSDAHKFRRLVRKLKSGHFCRPDVIFIIGFCQCDIIWSVCGDFSRFQRNSLTRDVPQSTWNAHVPSVVDLVTVPLSLSLTLTLRQRTVAPFAVTQRRHPIPPHPTRSPKTNSHQSYLRTHRRHHIPPNYPNQQPQKKTICLCLCPSNLISCCIAFMKSHKWHILKRNIVISEIVKRYCKTIL